MPLAATRMPLSSNPWTVLAYLPPPPILSWIDPEPPIMLTSMPVQFDAVVGKHAESDAAVPIVLFWTIPWNVALNGFRPGVEDVLQVVR